MSVPTFATPRAPDKHLKLSISDSNAPPFPDDLNPTQLDF